MPADEPSDRSGPSATAPLLESDLGLERRAAIDFGQDPVALEDPGRGLRPIRRYALLDQIGKGGMGVVYAAYDARLDRKVAIKVLRHEESASARARFTREARALAKLRHPNVVVVHDAGEVGERPYLAMELVDGTSLGVWLSEAPRSWQAIRDVFVHAGRGLAAAHAAGLVHRDVKPGNILVGRDGSVRVVDFGLVRLDGHDTADDTDDGGGDGARTATEPAALDLLTRRSGVIGTPRYMAPEQADGQSDARSDQYSFCVSLRDALAGTGAPMFLTRAIERGLAADPAARFPDMDALLAELGRDPARARRRAVLAGTAVLALAAIAMLSIRLATAGSEPCLDAGLHLAGNWDPAVRARLESRFLSSGNPRAADISARVARDLDDYAGAWTAMRTEACRATAVRGEQSQALLDLRMTCLDRRLGQLHALTEVLGPTATVERAIGAVARLEPLSTCADADALAQAIPPPSDPADRSRVQAARKSLDAAIAQTLAFQLAAARDTAGPIVAEARRLGYPPLLAEALYYRSNAELSIEMGKEGPQAEIEEAITLAARSRDARLETRAWTSLVRTRVQQGHAAEALALVVGARAALERAGHPPGLALTLGQTVGYALAEAGKLDEAAAELEGAVAAAERTPGVDTLTIATGLNDLAVLLRDQGKVAESVAMLERAGRLYELRLGRDAIPAGGVLINLATSRKLLGDYAGAQRDLERALAVMELNLGPDNPQVAMVLTNLSSVTLALGHTREAERQARRALAIKEKAYGADGLRLGSSLENLAQILATLGQDAEARGYAARAVAVVEKGRGPGHVDVAEALLVEADVDRTGGHLAEAEAAVRRAVAILAERHAPDRRDYLFSVIEVLQARGRYDEALVFLERMDAVKGTDAVDAARIDFLRASASWGAKRDRPAALALARRAEARLDHGRPDRDALRARINSWLAER